MTPPKELPASPNLRHLHDQARDLLRALVQADPEARQRVMNSGYLPAGGSPSRTGLTVAQAQQVIAHEYGFASWSDLKQAVEAGPAQPATPATMPRTAPTSKEVFEALGEPEAWQGDAHRWDEAMAACPAGPLPFLETSGLSGKCTAAGIAADRVPLLEGMAREIAGDPHLRALAWYLHWRVAVVMQAYKGGWNIPTLTPRLGKRSGLFYLLLLLEFPRHIEEWKRAQGVPSEVIADSLRTIADQEAMHLVGEGAPGIYADDYRGWSTLTGLDSSDIHVRLGRFEYGSRSEWGEYYYPFRRDSDGAVLALIGGGLRVTDDGLMLAEDDASSPGWTTTWEKTDHTLTANPIHPCGRVLRRAVSLPLSAWRQVPAMTGPGQFDSEARLDIDVPFGGGMDWETALASLRQADAFFRKHLPQRPIRIINMLSWFLDPRLPEILGDSSNIAKFQRACYLAPDPPASRTLYRMVFQRDHERTPVDDLPTRTSLQRAIVGFLKGGGVWHGGNMFILPEHLPDLREGFYLDRFAALSREFSLG